jgi:hypothetical protein
MFYRFSFYHIHIDVEQAFSQMISIWDQSRMETVLKKIIINLSPIKILSEFMIVQSAFSTGRYIVLGLFLLGALAIFLTILKYILDMIYATPNESIKKNNKVSWWNRVIINLSPDFLAIKPMAFVFLCHSLTLIL